MGEDQLGESAAIVTTGRRNLATTFIIGVRHAAAAMRILLRSLAAWRLAPAHGAWARAHAHPPSARTARVRLLSSEPQSAPPAAPAAPQRSAAETLPFKVFRTNYNELPVYSDYRNGRTRVLTLVRKYAGDADALAKRLARLCDQPQTVVKTGRIEIKGLHVRKVRAYLQSLGF